MSPFAVRVSPTSTMRAGALPVFCKVMIPPPSIVVLAEMVLLPESTNVFAPPQLKVTVPSKCTAVGRHRSSAVSVQLELVPKPTMHAGAIAGMLTNPTAAARSIPPQYLTFTHTSIAAPIDLRQLSRGCPGPVVPSHDPPSQGAIEPRPQLFFRNHRRQRCLPAGNLVTEASMLG